MAKSTEKKTDNKCSFCDKPQKDIGWLVEGKNKTFICECCIDKGKGVLDDQRAKTASKRSKFSIPTPRDVYNHLNRFVVGQDQTKKKLSVAVINHYKRLMDLSRRPTVHDPELSKVKIGKSNVLLLGPTGTGKTLLAQSLAERLDVPFAIGDATTLTEAGYVGEDVENLLLKLIQAADYDIERAQAGIIYIDELDKLHKTSSNTSITRDVSGEGVQHSLLKMLEGTVSSVPPQGGRKHPEQQYLQIDTTNILFICGGAFVGLEDIISQRIGRGSFGFSQTMKVEEEDDILSQVEQEDLEKFGLVPELVGRLPVIATLKELSLTQLERILSGADGQPENALIKQYQKIGLMDDVRLEFTPDAISEIAKIAKAKGTGARALRAAAEAFMDDVMFEMPEHRGSTVVIDAAVVRREKTPYGPKAEAA